MVNRECNQRDIARKLNLTPQAISEHFKELINEDYVRVIHKGYYEVTKKGEDWMSKNLMEIHTFSEDLLKKLYSKSVVAIAQGEINEGDSVIYWFSDGYVFARRDEQGNGVAMTSAGDGEDVLIRPTGSFKPPAKGEIIIVKVPDVAEGGSRKIDLYKFKELVKNRPMSIVVAVGIEALVTCRKIKIEPIFFGAKDVCIEAAHHGSGVIAVCTESLIDDLLRSLLEEDLKFEVKEMVKE
jgi:putative transcriptional regulator